jgi:hypothetical protein
MSTEVGSSPHPHLVLAATTLANAMVVPLTLPAIMRHYDIGSQSAQWALNGSLGGKIEEQSGLAPRVIRP